LVAGLLQDDLLGNSLRQLYLEPLESERDGGAALRQTLMSYFVADRNMSSAAAALGVNRRTVANHLQAIEQLWGRPMRECAMEAEAALRLADLDGEV
jgi:sugar diacid utilization regulator